MTYKMLVHTNDCPTRSRRLALGVAKFESVTLGQGCPFCEMQTIEVPREQALDAIAKLIEKDLTND